MNVFPAISVVDIEGEHEKFARQKLDTEHRLVQKVNFWVDQQALVCIPSKVDLNVRLIQIEHQKKLFNPTQHEIRE